MHWRNPSGGGSAVGTHTFPGSSQLPDASPTHPRANFAHGLPFGNFVRAGGSTGEQPVSIGVGASMWIDCTQGTPLQSCPTGIPFSTLHDPSQSLGASNAI